MFESFSQKLLPRFNFVRRVALHLGLALFFVIISLLIGAYGYHYFADLAWIDAVLNASMILTGMGPVAELHSDAAKIFASCYAIYSGVAFVSAVGIIFAPIVHRMLHNFHLDD